MFGSKKNASDSKSRRMPSGNDKALNTIVSSTSIEGNIKSDHDIRIDGNLVGDLVCGAKVIIGPGGKVNGEINCINAVIEGKFEGNIIVQESLTLAATAVVKANIQTNKWVVASGAVFNGACKMGNAPIPTPTSKSKEKQKQQVAERTT